MPIPYRITVEDLVTYSNFLSKKASGATFQEIKSALGASRTDARKISGLRYLGIIEEREGKYRATETAREISKTKDNTTTLAIVLVKIIANISPYWAILERVYHRQENSLTTPDIGSHWHDNFSNDVSSGEDLLSEQVTTFFQIAEGAGLGKYIKGRRGSQTRLEFNLERIGQVIENESRPVESLDGNDSISDPQSPVNDLSTQESLSPSPEHSQPQKQVQGIFVAHGKNKKPLEELKKILEQFKIPYKVAIDEPNLGRPISEKVKETMETCNCAILIFTADEEFKDKDGNTIWRPSENVVFELGASSFLYESRIVILKEQNVIFPSNYRDIGYISFDKDQLGAKAMEVLRELIGFGIVKVST